MLKANITATARKLLFLHPARPILGRDRAPASLRDSFFYKGTNGCWRDMLSEEELALYDEAAMRELTPDCPLWLETAGAPWT